MHAFDFGAVLFEHSIATACKTIPYFFFSFPELVFMAYSLRKFTTIRCFVMYLMYCKGFLEGVQRDLRSDSVLVIVYLERQLNDRSNLKFE